MGTNLEGSMDGRLERASESRREDLRLDGGGMMSNGLCAGEVRSTGEEDGEGEKEGREGG
jgi:hypothetical protein